MSGTFGGHPPVERGSCSAPILLRRRATTGASRRRRRSHGARTLARTRGSPPSPRRRSPGWFGFGAARGLRHLGARRGPEPRTAVAPHAVAQVGAARRGPRRRERRRPGRRTRVRGHRRPSLEGLPVAGRRPPHPHAVQQRRHVPGRRPGPPARPARHGLAGHHRPRQRRPTRRSVSRRSTRTSGGPRRLRRTCSSSRAWSGTSRPPSTARSSCTPARTRSSVLKQFETGYDGGVKGATDSTPANEALAVAGLNFLAEQVKRRKVQDALMLANHPARKGIDSPHEIRAWRDAAPRPYRGRYGGRPRTPGRRDTRGLGTGRRGRGLYDGSPGANSFAGIPAGELPHLGRLRLDDRHGRRPVGQPARRGQAVVDHRQLRLAQRLPGHRGPRPEQRLRRPTAGTTTRSTAGRSTSPQGDFWPGYYSRTHVGADGFSYAAVMDGIRAGRIWVDHGAAAQRPRRARSRAAADGAPSAAPCT